jgi:hypothetical protein
MYRPHFSALFFSIIFSICFLSPQSAICDDLTGKSKEEIEKRFGNPDNKLQTTTGERWSYGASMVFFEDKNGELLVSAWSDLGEFAERKILEDIKEDDGREKHDQMLPPGWSSDWQQDENSASDVVVDELIEANPQSGFKSSSPKDGSLSNISSSNPSSKKSPE